MVAGMDTAVNTGVIVAGQNSPATPVRFATWHVDKSAQRDNRRNRKPIPNGTEEVACRFNDDGLFSQQQIDSTRHRNYSQRLPTAAIKKKHTSLQVRLPSLTCNGQTLNQGTYSTLAGGLDRASCEIIRIFAH